ncbi:MAG TPA: type II secretion system F family protein [Nitrospiria bacterium]
MPFYQYRARDKHGSLFTGVIETAGRDAVAMQLDQLGYFPIAIEEKSKGMGAAEFLERYTPIAPQELVIFSRQLATLISAGVPFMSSFDAIIEQTENKRLKKAIEAVRRDVESGSSFSDGLAKHPSVFSRLYVSMIRAGETGGVLDEILQRLAVLAEHEAETRARIKAATRYPKIVIGALLIAVFILLQFVVPRFAALYANFNATLPLPTRILIGINRVFQDYGWMILVGMAIAGYALWSYVRTVKGRLWWDGIKLRLPVFGVIFKKSALSRFARVFGTLTRSGLSILQTLEIVSETVGNRMIARVVDNIRDSAREGRGVVQPMQVSRIFPPVVIQMVAIGEQTGKMEEMLMKVSDYYDQEVEYSIRNLSTSLEPLLLAVIGGVVLFLALAIFMPWWNLINVMKGGGG